MARKHTYKTINRNDHSPALAPEAHDERCGWCLLNVAHSVDSHDREMRVMS